MNKNEALEVLGLADGATEEDIRRTYKRLALLYHPDKHAGKEQDFIDEKIARFKKISEAHDFLTKSPEDNTSSYSNAADDLFASFFKVPTKEEYLEAFSELFNEAELDLSNLQVFNAMTEEEIEIVAHNLGKLYEHSALNQESFDIACQYVTWPDKRYYDIANPYVFQYIFENYVTGCGLTMPSNFKLSHAMGAVEGLTELLGIDEDDELMNLPSVEKGLLTQERLNLLVTHSGSARDIALAITQLTKVGLLTSENEIFIIEYLSKMGSSMFSIFAHALLNKNKEESLKVLNKAHEKIDWLVERESLSGWSNRNALFKIVEVYLNSGLISAVQLNSFNYLLLGFITTPSSKNFLNALALGLVTVNDLDNICQWSEEHKTYNDDYLRYLLSDDGVKLLKAGLLSPKDAYKFLSPHDFRGYIEEQARRLNAPDNTLSKKEDLEGISQKKPDLNKQATKIQQLIRGHLSRKKVKEQSQRTQSSKNKPDLGKISAKIQALIRGHLARQKLINQSLPKVSESTQALKLIKYFTPDIEQAIQSGSLEMLKKALEEPSISLKEIDINFLWALNYDDNTWLANVSIEMGNYLIDKGLSFDGVLHFDFDSAWRESNLFFAALNAKQVAVYNDLVDIKGEDYANERVDRLKSMSSKLDEADKQCECLMELLKDKPQWQTSKEEKALEQIIHIRELITQQKWEYKDIKNQRSMDREKEPTDEMTKFEGLMHGFYDSYFQRLEEKIDREVGRWKSDYLVLCPKIDKSSFKLLHAYQEFHRNKLAQNGISESDNGEEGLEWQREAIDALINCSTKLRDDESNGYNLKEKQAITAYITDLTSFKDGTSVGGEEGHKFFYGCCKIIEKHEAKLERVVPGFWNELKALFNQFVFKFMAFDVEKESLIKLDKYYQDGELLNTKLTFFKEEPKAGAEQPAQSSDNLSQKFPGKT